MAPDTWARWAVDAPVMATAVAIVAAATVALCVWAIVRASSVTRRALRGTPSAVVVAAVAAGACTAYTADTSWRFAAEHLDMDSGAERAAMFAAAELALFACALMARQNLRTRGTPGTPGLLVWVITGVQIIPPFAISGVVGGGVRAFVGPVCAALLWHLAMGIEIRHTRPDVRSGGLLATVGRELRERLLSWLGLATRDRSAEQITRDRWTVRAVALAARLADTQAGTRSARRIARRLSVAVGRAQVGADPEQRRRLLELLAARLHASTLATINLPSPWQDAASPAPAAIAPQAPPAPEPEPQHPAAAAPHDGAPHSDGADEAPRTTPPAAPSPARKRPASGRTDVELHDPLDIGELSKAAAVRHIDTVRPGLDAPAVAQLLAQAGHPKATPGYVRNVRSRSGGTGQYL